ncbi:hypothetical protein VP01_5999g1, partial [Puccinia sorghi]
MRFFALITLLVLLQIQSQTAHADFICNNSCFPNAKVGNCAIREAVGPKYLVEPASVVNQVSRTFTCSQTTILGKAPSWRWCCSKSPNVFSSKSGMETVFLRGHLSLLFVLRRRYPEGPLLRAPKALISLQNSPTNDVGPEKDCTLLPCLLK